MIPEQSDCVRWYIRDFLGGTYRKHCLYHIKVLALQRILEKAMFELPVVAKFQDFSKQVHLAYNNNYLPALLVPTIQQIKKERDLQDEFLPVKQNDFFSEFEQKGL